MPEGLTLPQLPESTSINDTDEFLVNVGGNPRRVQRQNLGISGTGGNASDITNDSGVTGVKVSDALDTLDAAIPTVPSLASQAEAEAGTENTKIMTALRTAQAIAELAAGAELGTDLTAIEALTPTNDDVIQRKSGAWTNRSMAQLASDLSLSVTAAADGRTYVNSFYTAAMVSAGLPDDTAHPLSEFYGSPEDAQVDFPNATSLNISCDTAVWRKCADYCYDSLGGKYASAHVVADGYYRMNERIPWNIPAIWIEGTKPNQRYGGTRLRWTSLDSSSFAGTVDAPESFFDFYTFDEDGAAAPGREFDNAYPGPKVILQHLTFNGPAGAMSSSDQSAGHYYVSGVRIRQAAFVQIENCAFDQTLYDGVFFTGPQLFTIITRNWFGGCARDGISNWRGPPGNNSTTIWIYNNEFIGPHRYSILLDLTGGAVEQKPIIRDNSFEHTTTVGYYYSHPEWWCQGVIACVCILSGNDMVFDANRFEGFEDNYYADLHIVGGQRVQISNNVMHNLVVSSVQANDFSSSAFDSFISSNNFSDITDTRNYNIGHTANPGTNTEGLVIDHNYHLDTIFYPDNLGGAQTGTNVVRDQALMVVGVPTMAGTYVRLITPRNESFPTLLSGLGLQSFVNVALVGPKGGRTFWYGDNTDGSYRWFSIPLGGTWQANTSYELPTAAIYSIRAHFRKPTTENGFFYIITTPGISNDTEPTWGTTIGGTTADNAGSAISPSTWASDTDYSVGDWVEPGTPNGYYYYCATAGASGANEPTFGTTTGGNTDDNGFDVWQASTVYTVGDKVMRTSSASLTYYWECTTGGTSNDTEPTWAFTFGGTVPDTNGSGTGDVVWTTRAQINWTAYPDSYAGAAVWTCVGKEALTAEVNTREWLTGAQRNKTGSAAPTAGRWAVGDKVWNTGPAAGGSSYTGWVCTTAGVAGVDAVFKGFGLVQT